MTLRHMQIFSALCENGYNTTKTAQALHMTQPAVSLVIKELEQYYNVVLFDRLGRRLVITPYGETLLQYARQITATFNEMEEQMTEQGRTGILRIGASLTIGSEFMPDYVSQFLAKHEDCDIRVKITSSEKLEELLLSGDLDFALIEGAAHSPFLYSEEYRQGRLAIVVSPDSPLVYQQTLPLDFFVTQKFLLREKGSGTRGLIDLVLDSNGYHLTPIWESSSTSALINAVRSGLGISILPYRLVRPLIKSGELAQLFVDELKFDRSFRIIYHKDKYLTNRALEFLQMCRSDDRK